MQGSKENQDQVANFEMLQKLEKDVGEAGAIMAQRVQQEDVIICLGSTRGGKSTLVNYLIGTELKGEKSGTKIAVVKGSSNETNGPAIGVSATSETVLPSAWISKKSGNMFGQKIWDAPGFDDNRGEVQDITNAFYIKALLTGVKSAKLVLVTDFNDLKSDNIKPFTTLLESVERIFGEHTVKIFDAVSVIFTKAPKIDSDDNVVDKEFLSLLLQEKILNSQVQLSKVLHDLVSSFVSSPTKIGIFLKASIGVVDNENDCGIIDAIMSTNKLATTFLAQVSPGVSEKSMNFLWNERAKLSGMKEIDQLLLSIEQIYHKVVDNTKLQVKNASKEDLQKFSTQIAVRKAEAENLLGKEGDSFLVKLQKISALDVEGAGALITHYGLISKARFIEFVDGLLKINESGEFKSKLEKTVIYVIRELSTVDIDISTVLGRINKEEAAKLLSESEAKYSKMVQDNAQKINKIMQENAQKMNQIVQENAQKMQAAQNEMASVRSQVSEFKGKTDSLQKQLDSEKSKPPVIVEKIIHSGGGGGGGCVILSLDDVEYENPILNVPELLLKFSSIYGADATSKLIDIIEDLSSSSLEDKAYITEMLNGSCSLEICSDLVGESIDGSI